MYPETRKPYQAPNHRTQVFKDINFLLRSGWPSPCLGKHEPSGPGNASPAFFQTAVINLSLSTTLPKDTIKIHICVFSPEGKPSEISRVLEVFVEMQKALIRVKIRSNFFPTVISDTSTRFL